MKLLIIVFLLSLPLITQAGIKKEIYTTAQEEISHYYENTGSWELIQISNLVIISKKMGQFIIVTASTIIKNKETGVSNKENCIITLQKENLSPYSVNCF